MHTIAELGANVPAFLGKLWKMVEDPVTNDLISWSATGTSFVIKDEIRFARELLPMYYKHNNLASFIRQLNMYGFHKIVSPDSGSMKLDSQDEIKFKHPCFMRGHPYLLENIKRKIGVSKGVPAQLGEKNPQVITKVLTEMRQIKGRQENMDSRLTAMKMENGALWRELSEMRKKYLKQQQIVNKLIQFLVSVVQQNHNGFSVKRKFPRMLHDKSPQNLIVNGNDMHEDTSNPSHSPMGPVIHELDPAEVLLETVVNEANSEDPYVSEYYPNQSREEDATEQVLVNVESPKTITIHKYNDPNMETIIGLPEDTLVVPEEYFISTNPSNEGDLLRPKYIKVLNRKPKQNGQPSKKTSYVLKDNTSFENPDSNPKLVIKTEKRPKPHEIIRPNKNVPQQICKLQINPQKSSQKSQQNNVQKLKKRQSYVTKNQQTKLLKVDRRNIEHVVENPNIYKINQRSQGNKNKQPTVLKTDQKTPSTEPLITIPFDTGILGDELLAESTHSYLDGEGDTVTIPMIVEVSPDTSCLTHASTSTPSPAATVVLPPTPPTDSPHPAEAANKTMQVACVSDGKQVTPPSPLSRSAYSLDELDSHLENVQSDLDNLKELLMSEGISLDANALLGYFNDDPLSYNISDPVCSDQSKDSMGNELITYNPSLLDLTDLMGSEWSLPTSPSEELPVDDTFAEVNTPQFVPQSPSFPAPDKKRKK